MTVEIEITDYGKTYIDADFREPTILVNITFRKGHLPALRKIVAALEKCEE